MQNNVYLSFSYIYEHLTLTALLLLKKAKVQKIPCDQLSVNMAARQMFGTRDLVWPVTSVVTRATCVHVSMITPTGVYKKTKKKRNRQTHNLRHLITVMTSSTGAKCVIMRTPLEWGSCICMSIVT